VKRSSRALLAAFILIAGFAVLRLTQPDDDPPRTNPSVVKEMPPAAAPPARPTATATPAPPPLPDPPRDAPPALVMPEPEGDVPAVSSAAPSPARLRTDLEDVQLALRDFRTGLGENPVGNNAEITKALLGDNLKQIKIPLPNGSQLNAQGELCDRFGTPYFFHQLSGTQMEIRSAGPDRQMWTADDVQR
jgi:hypothetical protein